MPRGWFGRGFWWRGNPFPFCRWFPWLPRWWWAYPLYWLPYYGLPLIPPYIGYIRYSPYSLPYYFS